VLVAMMLGSYATVLCTGTLAGVPLIDKVRAAAASAPVHSLRRWRSPR